MLKTGIVLVIFNITLLFGSVSLAGIPDKAEDVCPIKIGQDLPKIQLKDINGKSFDLNQAVSKQPTLLIFYRGSWCPYCNTHLGELKTIEPKLKEMGYQVIAVSPDLPENLKTSVEKNDLEYSLVSDSKAKAAKALGLAFRVDDETYQKYLGYNINLEKASGEKHHLLPIPAAILLDTEGKVKFVFSSPDYTVRVDSQLILSAAKSAAR